jgi:hypothetical protein
MLANDGAASKLATSLEEIADRLGKAHTATEFVAALDANAMLWEKVRRFAGDHNLKLPPRVLDFSLSSSSKGGKRLSDHDVEVLIHINRSASSRIRQGAGALA